MQKRTFVNLLASLGLLLLAWMPLQPVWGLALEHSPYLQTLSSSQVTLRWRTDVISDSRVAYGSAPDQLTEVVNDQVQTTEHSITLTGLAAGTTYYYSVGSSSQVLAGGDRDHFFKTAPATGTALPVSIWVVGDSGTADGNARAVRDAYLQYRGSNSTDLFLMLGDNAYNYGTDSEYTRAVFDMYPMVLRQTPLWPTMGNHDARTKAVYFDVFSLPTNAESGGVASGSELFYSFDYANIHFVVLDSQLSDRSTSGTMMRWLEQDLSQTTQPWIIAFWHHPPYTKGSHDSDRESRLIDMRENALPILEQYGVDLVLSGHSHSYERSYLLNGHYGYSDSLNNTTMILDSGDGSPSGDGAYRKSDAKGAVYAVAGSSGKISGGRLDHPAMYVSMNRLGSMAIDIDGQQLDAVFIDSNGNIRDRFSIVKGGSVNQRPRVDAGTDLSVLLGQRVSLDGSASDDGLPNPPGRLTLAWSKLDGPGVVDFADPTALDTTAGFSQAGSYRLQLSADDGEYEVSDSLTVTVIAVNNNQPPVVDAGNDIDDARVGVDVELQGSARDDGLPASPGRLTLEWRQQSGPGQVVFADSAAAMTQVRFDAAGSYVLRLTASDGDLSAFDEVAVTVLADSSGDNRPPAFVSGTIRKPDATAGSRYDASLSGDASDPDGDRLRFSMISGPGWLDVGEDGRLEGTPGDRDVGENAFRVQVTDPDGLAATARLEIRVESASDEGSSGGFVPMDLLALSLLLLILVTGRLLPGRRSA